MTSRHTVLLIDGEAQNLAALEKVLKRDHRVLKAASGAQAIDLLRREKVDLILTNHRIADMTGVRILNHARKICPAVVRMIITDHTETMDVIDAINTGRVTHFFTKPWEPDHLRTRIREALNEYSHRLQNARLLEKLKGNHSKLHAEVKVLRNRLPKAPGDHGIIGQSPAILRVVELMTVAAGSEINVLITGETGTGKELLARSIHGISQRRGNAFVAQNCGSIPEGLLESELFGHKRGSFTGAHFDKPGLFEVADGGTVLLDEIADTPPSLQVRLLRFLEERAFRRIGETHQRKVDVRIISATNRILEDVVAAGTFREDLYYRLNAFPVHIVPLRQRREDIPPLASAFLTEECGRSGKRVDGFSPGAMELLCNYDFPGNVRELANEVSRSVAFVRDGGTLTEDLLSNTVRQAAAGQNERPKAGGSLKAAVEQLEKEMILKCLARNNWNKSRTAETLGLSRVGLNKKILRYGLKQTPC